MKIFTLINSISTKIIVLLMLGFLLAASACSLTSQVKRVETISDPKSPLLNAITCDEMVAATNNWSWTFISLFQTKKADGDELVLCTMTGYYQKGSNQYWGFLRISLVRYADIFTLDQDKVVINSLREGKPMNLPAINFSTNKPMFRTCLQDSKG